MPEPSDEVEQLVIMLRDPNPGVRQMALRRLADSTDASLMPLVKAATQDPDSTVAAQAEGLLGALIRRGVDPRIPRPRPGSFSSIEREPAPRTLEGLRRVGLAVLRPHTQRIASFLTSPSSRLGQAAAMALAKIADPSSLEALREGLASETVAAECARALSRISDPRVGDLIVRLLESTDRPLLKVVMDALDGLRDPRILVRLRELTSHADEGVRADAVRILGDLGEPDMGPDLVGLLNDASETVIIQAIDALRKLSYPGIIDQVIVRFGETANARVRATLLTCLIHHPRDDRVIELLSSALRDTDARVRANAVEALGSLKIAPDSKRALLSAVLDDESNRVLANLAIALGPLDLVHALTILMRLLNSTDKRARASAVYAAGFVGETRVGGWLASALVFEDDEDVIRNIIRSLSRHRDSSVLEQLAKALHHPKKVVRFGTARILGNLGDRGSRPAIVKALEHEDDPTVKAEMIAALAKLSDTSHIPQFVRHLKDADPRVQANVIDGLDALGAPEIIPHVGPFVASLDPRVKANAARALWAQGQIDVVRVLGQMLESAAEREVLSAIYALGELGSTLTSLADTHRYYILSSALRERGRDLGFVETDEPPIREAERLHVFLLDHWDVLDKLQAGCLNGAVDDLEKALCGAAPNPVGHYLAGELHRRAESLDKAAAHLQTAESQAHHFLPVFLSLANLHHQQGDTQQALVYYLKGLREKVALLRSEIELALEFAKSQRLQEASLMLKTLLEQVPLELSTHARIGSQALRYGDTEKAFEHLALAFVTDPSDRQVQYDLALAALRLSFRPLARRLVASLLSALPEIDPLHGLARDLWAQLERQDAPGVSP